MNCGPLVPNRGGPHTCEPPHRPQNPVQLQVHRSLHSKRVDFRSGLRKHVIDGTRSVEKLLFSTKLGGLSRKTMK
jgi:hypothetical protein